MIERSYDHFDKNKYDQFQLYSNDLMDCNTVLQIVKVIRRWGFVFNLRDQLSSSRRPRKKQPGPIKVFGRNVNSESKHRAKRVFMKNNSTRTFTNRTSSSIGGGNGSSFRSSASLESAPERNLLSYGSSSSSFMNAESLAPAIESPPASPRSSMDDDPREAQIRA
ncbi:hypothetical protein PybrP1_003487 [[Pythium] brassicae (nom. inval.)]|nr:hypothetical protein PybrP1_003487 [[Pythium] brassicae (nom. inval.)]